MPKLILISDTHGYRMELPKGDILIHAGDLSSSGSFRQCQETLNWLNSQPHKHVVMVAGNHDFAFENPKCTSPVLDLGRIIYLENSGTEIEGLKIYGSPITPKFMDWAFMVPRGEEIRKVWDLIPEGLDVLITHGPPKGILDQASPHFNTDHLGCEELAVAIARVKPHLHVFGHIHGGRGYKAFDGTEFFNASVVSEAYRLAHDPWEVDFDETNNGHEAPIAVNDQFERTNK